MNTIALTSSPQPDTRQPVLVFQLGQAVRHVKTHDRGIIERRHGQIHADDLYVVVWHGETDRDWYPVSVLEAVPA